jgi:hypothetical protein
MSGERGFQVPTTPIVPGRDRQPWLVVGLLAAIIVAAFALARWTSDADRDRSTTNLPSASMPLAEAVPVPSATPLPLIQWFTGSEAPLDDVLLEAGRIRRLKLASAHLGDDALALPGRDLLLPAPRGATICLCWQGSGPLPGEERRLDLVRQDRDGREISRTSITSVDGPDQADPADGPTRIALEPSPDGRFAYLARARRSGTRWQVSLDVIDTIAGSIVDTVDLIAGPAVGSTRILSIEAPQLRTAPDGRHLLLTAGVLRDPLIGPGMTSRAWIAELDANRIGTVVEADVLADPSAAACDWVDFATADLIVRGCRVQVEGQEPSFKIQRYDLEGRDLGALVVAPWRTESGDPLLDVTHGVAYTWDPVAHVLRSVDLVEGVEHASDGQPIDVQPPAAVQALGSRPPQGAPVAWSDGRSATDARGPRTLVGSPDGRLLFAVGVGSVPEGSSGVWVLDAQTLDLVERWPAAAAYTSIALLEDGRWLAAIGRPGVTGTGDPAAWSTSLTVHDAITGRPVLIIGDLRTDADVTFALLDSPAPSQ